MSILSDLREIDTTPFAWRGQLVKQGPVVGVVTFHAPPYVDGEFLDRAPRWQALVDTETTARAVLMGDSVPIEVDGMTLRNIEAVDEAEYLYLAAHSDWAKKHDPSHPKAQPRKPIDFNTLPMRF